MSSQKTLHVGVIGAGMAGLRCAEVLLEHGCEVTVLEARQRIGGRVRIPSGVSEFEMLNPYQICQSGDLGFKVDMGANWIHTFGFSRETHPILAIANQTKSRLNIWRNDNHFYDSQGNRIGRERGDQLMGLLQDIFDEAFAFSAQFRKSIPSSVSMHDFVSARVKKVALEHNEDPSLLMQFADTWSGYVGQSIKNQGLKFAYLDECCGEEQYFAESTYEAILEKVSRLARQHGNLMLDRKVTAVQTVDSSTGAIRVRTDNGESYNFDELVLTIPLGWLKKNQSIFKPPLPLRLMQAIDSIGVATFEKIYILFPRAFWLSSSQQNPFTGFTEWFSPSYATSTNPKRYQIEAWSLASSAQPSDHYPVILFYTHGALAEYLTSTIRTLPDLSDSSSSRHAFLSEFFTPYFSLLPNYDERDDGCTPVKILSTDWNGDELAGWGSFCNFPVGMEDAEGDIQALREGCEDRGIWFAGEYVAPVGELGTVAGAWLSGQAAARSLLSKHGKS